MTRPSRTRFHSNKIRSSKESVCTGQTISQFIDEAEARGFQHKLPEVSSPKGVIGIWRIKSKSLTITAAEFRAYKQRWEACKARWTAEGDPRADQMTPIRKFRSGSIEAQNAEGFYFIVRRNTD